MFICGASLTVAAGEAVALLGRNGMGKTTLIRSVMGLAPPQVRSGEIRWRAANRFSVCGLMRSLRVALPSYRKGAPVR
jgi:ABC-type branched-subunit amino acid transport system ATPase component